MSGSGIIIGLGNYGHVLAEELSALGHEVIGADISAGSVVVFVLNVLMIIGFIVAKKKKNIA